MTEPGGPERPVPVELLDLAVATALEAAELVRSARADGVRVAATKSSDVDVVTEADRASERLIRERLLGARPGDGFLGEEGGAADSSTGVVWVVDPIDGTVNFLYDIPQYAVSIAAEVDGEVLAGVVVDVAAGQVYAASSGGGATRDGEPLAVRASAPLAERLVATGFGYDADMRAAQVAAVSRMLPQVRDIRRFGAAALDLCAVACGRVDAYVEEGLNPWDHAAGALIAREAGARVEMGTGVAGRTLVICGPEDGFADFRTLVTDCGFEARS